jgi:hypothetical protein
LDAILFAQARGLLEKSPPAPFLDAALATGDKTLFLNVYRYFEEYGLIPISSHIDEYMATAESPYLGRYVSVFREFSGPQIDMEIL